MDLKDLQDYRKWIGKSPAEVLRSVKMVGGWERVLRAMPLWAQKVRNYFNEIPFALTLWDDDRANQWLYNILSVWRANNSWGPLAVEFAPSGDVYDDDAGRVWLQMTPGAAIYHFGSSPTWPTGEAILTHIRGQDQIPVIKLVHLDRTGGSCECIVNSLRQVPTAAAAVKYAVTPTLMPLVLLRYEKVIGWEGVAVDVSSRLVTQREHQASYNYSETMAKGLGAQELRDVAPHHRDPMGYVDPPFYPHYSTLQLRRFPANDNQGKPLADQV